MAKPQKKTAVAPSDEEPAKRKRGRRPQADTGEIMRVRALRMTDAEWAKLLVLGGAAWVRERIGRAKG